jgi:hypothetical protein
MEMKKLLALATAIVLMGVFLPLAVSASNPISNETQLRNAFSTLGSGTATLNADIGTLTTPLIIARTSTLDLNGHTLTIDLPAMSWGVGCIHVDNGAKFTVMCSIGTGILDVTNNANDMLAFAISVGFTSELIIESGTVNAESDGFGGIYVIDGGITINGGTINAHSGGGSGIYLGGEMTINGGTVNSSGNGVAGMQILHSEMTINGGTINVHGGGFHGIHLFNSEMTINGGTVNSSGNEAGMVLNTNKMTINGGTVNATGGSSSGILSEMGSEMTISGGTVNATGADGFFINTNSRIIISGGTVTAEAFGFLRNGISGGSMPDSIVIIGGSVHAIPGISGNVTNAVGAPVFLNTLTTDPLNVNSAVTSASFGGNSYGVKDVVTNASGQLFFYLPATSGDADARVSIGGSNFGAMYTRYADHFNTATLIPVAAGLSRADVQALLNLYQTAPTGAGILPGHTNRFNAARAMASTVAYPTAANSNVLNADEDTAVTQIVNALMVFENAAIRMHSIIAKNS